MQVNVGDIRSTEAYALGKMLDHSAWQTQEPKLPRGITPSDIDIVFDNAGSIIYGELSSQKCEWHQIENGQRWNYESAIKNSQHLSVLMTHNVRVEYGRKICSRNDIISFQPMIADGAKIHVGPVFPGNVTWQNLVTGWFNRPYDVRLMLFSFAAAEAGLLQNPATQARLLRAA